MKFACSAIACMVVSMLSPAAKVVGAEKTEGPEEVCRLSAESLYTIKSWYKGTLNLGSENAIIDLECAVGGFTKAAGVVGGGYIGYFGLPILGNMACRYVGGDLKTCTDLTGVFHGIGILVGAELGGAAAKGFAKLLIRT